MKYILLLLPFLVAQSSPAQSLQAQSPLPIIKASSKKVSINDGGFLDKNAWNLSPKIKLDVYTSDRTRKAKWVTFITDIDSIKVKVKPGTRFNFIVLLNGKDSCHTQIASAIPPDEEVKNIAVSDTIPFTLTDYEAIHVIAIMNDKDTLNMYFDIGSMGFDVTKDAIAKKTINKVATLRMGTMTWNNPDIQPTGVTSQGMDGRIGWDLFEGRKVQIDYEHMRLIIGPALPEDMKGYARTSMDFIRGYVCVKGSFQIEKKKYTGEFLLDTGSDEAIILDSGWAAKGNLQNLKLIKSSVLRDPRGIQYETKIVLAPLFTLRNFQLNDVPTLCLGGRNPTRMELNFLGNDLLKRFNIILDFKKDYVYFKPNGLMGVKYRETPRI